MERLLGKEKQMLALEIKLAWGLPDRVRQKQKDQDEEGR